MPIKIKRSQKRLIALTLTERAKPIFFRLLNKFIKEEVISSIESGRTPVGKVKPARYKKYSESYIEQIKGEASYFTKNRKVIRIPTDEDDDELKSFLKETFGNKKQSPVNLKLSGKMLRSIKSRKYRDYVRVWFTDSKAKYHDKLGAGKSKVKRRMVPDPKKGEQFNAGIRKRIVNALEKAIKLSKK